MPLATGLLACVILLLTSDEMAQRWSDALGVFELEREALNEALSLRPTLWTAAWQLFTEHWLNGVGTRGFGTLAEPALNAVPDLPDKPQGWSTHLALLDVAVGTGVIGTATYVVAYGWLVQWVWRAPFDTAGPGLTALMALFPLGSTLPFYSMRVGGTAWFCIAMAMVMASAIAGARERED
jgi:hypothetical protein